LRDATAAWLAHLHRLGIYHGDVKGVNVLVGGTLVTPLLYVVDTDRCRFFRRPVDLGRRIRNLAQLAASIPVVVSRTERLRWWRRYTDDLRLGDDLHRVASRVGALVGRKLRVVDAPIE
jgi:tRNA A-37 threonylcarbamoyl transferase component Bud32